MDIEVFKFSKRSNSTKQPTTGTTISNVFLKEDTSKYNPSFILENFDRGYTYLKWESRYYYIEDITSMTNNLSVVSCKIDVLASFKSKIVGSIAFILYSTSNYDTDIPDTRLSTKKNVIINSSTGSIYNNDGGCYFVSWLGYGTNSTSNPSCGLIAKGRTGFKHLQSILMNNDLLRVFTNITDISALNDTLEKKLVNINDCILQCHYLPISLSTSGNGSIQLGNSTNSYNTGVSVGDVSHDYNDSASLSIPWNFNDFRNRSQYSNMCIFLPGYGVAPLNIDDFQGLSSLTVNATLDEFTGALCYRIGDRYKFDCNIAMQMPLNTSSRGSLSGFMSGALSIGTSMASNNLSGSLNGSFNAVGSLLESNHGSIGSYGGSSSWLVNGNKIVLTITSHNTNVEPSSMATNYGRPLNKVATIPSSGYVQCTNASIESDNETLSNEINNKLNRFIF